MTICVMYNKLMQPLMADVISGQPELGRSGVFNVPSAALMLSTYGPQLMQPIRTME